MYHALSQKILGHLPRLEREQLESYLSLYVAREELLRQILDTMTEAVIAAAADTTIVFANAAVHDLLGVTAEEAQDKRLADVLRDPALASRVLSAGFDAYVSLDAEVSYPRRLTLAVQVIPLQRGGNAPADAPASLVLCRDITGERSRSDEQERASRLEALRLLTAGVAHEIGNPLSAIIMHAQLMNRTLGAMRAGARIDELKRISGILADESTRLKHIVGDFLHAVRPLSLRLRLGDVRAVVEDVFELFYSELTARSVAVVKTFDAVPETLFDADQLRGAIINIIRNAMDAMPRGGTISARVTNRAGLIELAFADDGCGIDRDQMAHVFTPFHTTKADGSGLGLFLVQRIVNGHGGVVRVKSTPGQGSEFIIDLPVRVRADRHSLPSPPRKKKP